MATSKGRPYFGVFFPEKSVDKGQRYMFFNSLQHLKNSPQGADLYNKAHDVILTGLNDIETVQNNDGLTLIEQAMTFLQQMIQQAKQDELSWIQEKITNNENIPRSMRASMRQFVKTGDTGVEFDYIQFTRYLNICLQGIDRYELNVTYESERLAEIEKLLVTARDIIEKHHRKMFNMMDRGNIPYNLGSTNPGEFEWRIAKQYLFDQEHHARQMHHRANTKRLSTGEYVYSGGVVQGSGRIKRFQNNKILNSKTLTATLAEQLEAAFTKVWKSKQLHSTLKKLVLTSNGEAIKKETVAFIVTTIGTHALPAINEIIQSHLKQINFKSTAKDKRENQKDITEEIANYIESTLQQYSTQEIEEDLSISELEDIVERAKLIQQSASQTEEVNKTLFQSIDIVGTDKNDPFDPNRKYDTFKNLSDDAIAILLPILEAEQKRQEVNKRKYTYKKRTKSAKQKTARAKAIEIATLLVRRQKELEAQRQGQKINLTDIQVKHTDMAKYLNELMAKRGVKIYISGGKNSIMSEVSGGEMIASLLAESNAKAVAEGITTTIQKALTKTGKSEKTDDLKVEECFVEIETDLQEDFKELSRAIYNSVLTEYDTRFKEDNKYSTVINTELARYVEDQIRNNPDNSPAYRAGEFNIKGTTERRIEQWKHNAQVLRQYETGGKRQAKLAKAMLQKLQQDIKISTTVKDYDKYNNNYGFHGGSLGGTLDHQVDNILYMFELGGITSVDRDWLLFSLYNTGNSMVGGKEKTRLEDFLSILAVSLLFTDIGEQWSFINGQLKNYTQIKGRYLHLYLLNGVYVPSSMILQMTYDGLCKIYSSILGDNFANFTSSSLKEIESRIATRKQGSRISIINTVTQAAIPHLPVQRKQDWRDTFEIGASKVSLQLTFLAGFLDILDALNKLSIK